MQIFNINLENINQIVLPKLVATIGQFDGLHIGHMHLINQCLNIKNKHNLKSAVITFNPRVDVIIKNDSKKNYLLDQESIIDKLTQLNIDYLLFINFSKEISTISHEDFFKKLLLPLNIQKLIVGFDFSYGYKGLGNATTISSDSANRIKPIIIEEQKINNEKIGTNQIKQYLLQGNILQANKLLGYNFFIKPICHNNYYSCENIHLLKDQKYFVLINGKEYLLEKIDNKLIILDNNYSYPNIKMIEFIK